MQHPAWILILVGLVTIAIGAAWLLAPSISWFGKLPGDIRIEDENVTFYFPVVTCIVISLLLTAIIWLARYFSH